MQHQEEKVTYIRSCANVPETMRVLADEFKKNDVTDVTIVANGQVYHLGQVSDERAAVESIWNLTYGTHKLMRMALNQSDN